MVKKLVMCRICLVENVRMYEVVNKSLQELYEKLTDIPFVTEDGRPMLACFFCCAKIKQCSQFQRKCLEAEELFAQMLDEDHEPNPLINHGHLELYGGFIKTPIEHIRIVEECGIESNAIKEEPPDVCERQDCTIELEEGHHTDELEVKHLHNIYSDVGDIPPHHSESEDPLHNSVAHSEGDGFLREFKVEVQVPMEDQKAIETNRVLVVKIPRHDLRSTKLEEIITDKQQKNVQSKITQNTQSTSKLVTKLKKPYICDMCQHSFSTKSALTRHIRIHTGEKPYKCEICQRSYSEKISLTEHIRVHAGEKPYKCEICQRSYCAKISLTNHIRIHTGEKLYKCEICQRSFSVKASLTEHIRVHTGEKPYKCEVCERSFSQKGSLTKHTRIHTGEKPYKCEICQRSFSVKITLTNHIRIHTGKKLFKCEICQRSFSQKILLTEHIRIHTGENPYKCEICQRGFTSKINLTRHIRMHIIAHK